VSDEQTPQEWEEIYSDISASVKSMLFRQDENIQEVIRLSSKGECSISLSVKIRKEEESLKAKTGFSTSLKFSDEEEISVEVEPTEDTQEKFNWDSDEETERGEV